MNIYKVLAPILISHSALLVIGGAGILYKLVESRGQTDYSNNTAKEIIEDIARGFQGFENNAD